MYMDRNGYRPDRNGDMNTTPTFKEREGIGKKKWFMKIMSQPNGCDKEELKTYSCVISLNELRFFFKGEFLL